MLPAAQPPACHDGSLAICLGMATLRAELEPACSLLQYSSPGTTKRATRASQTASTFKRAATPAPSGRTTQRTHEVASHSMLKAVCMAGRPMALTVHLVAQAVSCHDGSLAICLGMATLRAELEPACSLLQYPSQAPPREPPGLLKPRQPSRQLRHLHPHGALPSACMR